MSKKVIVFNLTPRSGMLHYASQFCNELTKRDDIELKVVIASYYVGDIYNPGISFFTLRTNPSFFSFLLDSLHILQHVKCIYFLISYKPEIVHFIDNHPWYIFYAALCQILGITIYTTQHDPTLHSGETKSLVGKIAIYTNSVLRKYSNILIVHGEKLKAELEKKYGVSSDKIIVVPHGAYTFFSQYSQNLEVQKNTFLFFGRILDYKGLDILLDALSYVKKEVPDFHLIIAGPGDISPYKEKIDIHKNQITVFNFEIEAEDIYRYFEISEFVVLPYNDATGSGVIPVAYCFHKAVIVTDVGELAYSVIDGETGNIIIPNNPRILAESILKMLQHKELTQEMGEKGYVFSLEKLSWKPIIDTIYKKYE